MSGKKNQCLFNFIDFYSKKSHLLFPASLAFPQYFAISMKAIAINHYQSVYFKNLCFAYCEILQTIINQIFNNKENKYKIIVDNNKLKTKIMNKHIDDNFILLETYLKDDESINNYRQALLTETLKYYNFENIKQYIHFLYEKKCCVTEEDSIIMPPSSKNYLIFGSETNTSFPKNHIFYTVGWGPFFWNIFHSVAETGKEEDKNLLKFIYALPATIPCKQCRDNYMNKIEIFENIYKNNNNFSDIYRQIHNEINYDVMNEA